MAAAWPTPRPTSTRLPCPCQGAAFAPGAEARIPPQKPPWGMACVPPAREPSTSTSATHSLVSLCRLSTYTALSLSSVESMCRWSLFITEVTGLNDRPSLSLSLFRIVRKNTARKGMKSCVSCVCVYMCIYMVWIGYRFGIGATETNPPPFRMIYVVWP